MVSSYPVMSQYECTVLSQKLVAGYWNGKYYAEKCPIYYCDIMQNISHLEKLL